MRKSRLRSRSLAVAVIASLLLALGPAAARAEDSVDDGTVAASDNETPDGWFVELTTPPTSDGTSSVAVAASQDAFRAAAKGKGVSYEERFAYGDLWNGFSVRATGAELAKLHGLDGMKALWPVVAMTVVEPASPGETIDLSTAITMTGADTVQAMGITGKNIKVAVIDTGIDYQNPDLGGCFGPSCRVFTGWDFVGDDYDAGGKGPALVPHPGPDPKDCQGHGTHVSGIVGARGLVTGVAPDVRFGAYRVFGCGGSTSSDIILAAMERALGDHMDVINMSFGSDFQWPQYPTAVGADRLVTKHGIVVVASIGNRGANGLYSSGAPGVGANVIGVASFDNVKVQLPYFTVPPVPSTTPAFDGKVGYTQATGSPNAPISGGATLVRTGTLTSAADACSALTAGSLTGKVALIRRGTCSFYAKSINAQAAGAIAVVLYNNGPANVGFFSPGVEPPVTAPPSPAVAIPVVATDDRLGALLSSELVAGPVTLAWTAEMARFPTPTGDRISGFSSYGMSPDLSLKPDIGAPGGNIYSTLPVKQGGHGNLSGTSMSSPHVAGAVALLLQASPKSLRELGPANVRDILMNTATPHNRTTNERDGLDSVHRQGAGMLNIAAAVAANARVTPGKLSLGESQSGPQKHTITITSLPGTGKAVTYTFSHQSATGTGSNTFSPTFNPNAAAVVFSVPSVTVKNNQSAAVDVTIAAPSSPLKGLYGGYLVVTSDEEPATTYRVPYAGFIGDYQSITVLSGSTRVCRADAAGNLSFVPASGTGTAGTFTFADATQTPIFCVHFDLQSRSVTFKARAAAGTTYSPALSFVYFPRNSSAMTVFALGWDGAVGIGASRATLANDIYEISVEVLKARGDPANPADTERVVLGKLTIARP